MFWLTVVVLQLQSCDFTVILFNINVKLLCINNGVSVFHNQEILYVVKPVHKDHPLALTNMSHIDW